ncbi:MAG: VTT domain-containing protein [Bryobacteraceae bacterium]|nr:VTT domain-containing protein [Bryobacteraceae bacterium]
MTELLSFLERHGYGLLFAVLFLEQSGLPLPAMPVLLAVGALCGQGKLNIVVSLGAAVAACLLADLIWYSVGRAKGRSILRVLCKVSLEPDTCVRATEDAFDRYGRGTLLVAKFIPGLNTVAPPLAALSGMPLRTFLWLDAVGALLYSATFAGLGWIFHREIARVSDALSDLGSRVFWLLAAALAVYLGIKLLQRNLLIRRFRLSRIEPEELAELMREGAEIAVVDLRHRVELEAEGAKLPGALVFRPEEIKDRHSEIPRGRDIILYCS